MAFRIANGDLLGNRRVCLHLLELPVALKACEGLALELEDCAFQNLEKTIVTDKLEEACKDIDIAFLVASVPLKPGEHRVNLLTKNTPIFKAIGEALSEYAKPTVRALVVGNPVNSNCLVAMLNAPKLSAENFSCMCTLDHNRSVSRIASHLKVPIDHVYHVAVWGNHAETQVPDITHVEVTDENGTHRKAFDELCRIEPEPDFIEVIAQRAWKVLEMRGKTSAGSAVNAALCHMRAWLFGTRPNDWISLGIPVPEGNSYGIKPGIIFSFPCTVDEKGKVHIVENLELNPEIKTKIAQTEKDLFEERETALKALAELSK
uniref:malate dehydrogenase n=1 Tax=Hypotrichomonas acosta TaxID=5735 RepID=Q9GSY3_9EUKA|nr:putative lactate dehydrogenase [Hypotrichomonas acosta]